MANVRWTDEQLAAIEHRNGTLLVSAAAGSGKTAVLVERLLRRVLDDREDISRFLMITYTNAAASELREKILTALSARTAGASKDAYIRRQLTLAHSANVSTIHAFCTRILRIHGHIIGLPGDFKILDESEGSVLRTELCNDVIEECYGEEWFLPAANALFGDRDDRELGETVLMLYNKSTTQVYPDKWLDGLVYHFTSAAESDIENTLWGKYMLEQTVSSLASAGSIALSCKESIEGDEDLQKAYLPAIVSDIALIAKLKVAAQQGWKSAATAFSEISFARLGTLRKYPDEEKKNIVKDTRNCVKKIISDIYDKWFAIPPEKLLEEVVQLAPVVDGLTRAVKMLRQRFSEEKLRRGVLDYSDLEHYALRLLVEEYDEERDVVIPTQTAVKLSEDFAEIMVDEYQDSNCIQDVIFRAVSNREKNIVMVGDIKQSIYRFRLADPQIFLKKYRTFKPYTQAQAGEPCRVNLTRNFRSRKQVLDGCNSLFSRIMSEELGDLKYTEQEYLNLGAEYEDYPEQSNAAQAVILDLEGMSDGQEEGELSPAAREIEADWIASEIRRMMDSGFSVQEKDGTRRKMRWGDVVLLMRSTSGKAHIYEGALSKHGIPCVSEQRAQMLSSPEISTVISMLTVIDNPLNEVALVGALRSPLFAFSADDLSRVRRVGGSFISAVELLSREQGETADKCREFLDVFYSLRQLSEDLSCDKLIWELYTRTNALGMVSALSRGQERRDNLLSLYQYARGFESNGYRGLYAFLERIARLAEKGEDIPVPASGGGDAVRIMTIHKSKGLEFPIVFLADFNHQFNTTDSRKRVIVHPELGVGMGVISDACRGLHPSLAQLAVTRKLDCEMKSEEMRVLYVALTRAREKLIIVCTLPSAEKKLRNVYTRISRRGEFSAEELNGQGPMPWLAAPLLCANEGAELRKSICADNCGLYDINFNVSVITPTLSSDISPQPQQENGSASSMGSVDEFAKRFEYVYPYELAAKAPSKLTATGLRTLVEENCISADGLAEPEENIHFFARPEFIKESGLTPTEKGIAAHLAMQLIDFSKCTDEESVSQELARLYAKGQLTQQQYEAVSPGIIMGFFNSPIGKEVVAAKELYREFRFSVLVPAEHLAPDETMLLQGVADLFYEKDGGIVLVDFKTDRQMSPDKAQERYGIQLSAYAYALEQITGKKVLRRVLFFLRSGQALEL